MRTDALCTCTRGVGRRECHICSTGAFVSAVEGDKWEMYIPSELGYGDRGSPPKIGGGDVLVFTMEIIKINGEKVPANKCDVKTLAGCSEQETKYIEAKKLLDADGIAAELKRLEGMKGKKMAPKQEGWVNKRATILNKLKSEL